MTLDPVYFSEFGGTFMPEILVSTFEDLTPGQLGPFGELQSPTNEASGQGSGMEIAGPSRNGGRRASEVHRIVWWRPHGDTAMAPGAYAWGAKRDESAHA